MLLRLVNTYCKPYLLYGAEVVNWTSFELSRMNYAYNSALIKSEIEVRTRTFVNRCENIDNAIVYTSHVFSVGHVTCVFLCVFIFCVFIYCLVGLNCFLCLFCYHVYW